MLKQRLIFGTLMIGVFLGLILVDGLLDGACTVDPSDDTARQGTIFCILVCLLMIPGHLEFAGLAAAKGLKVQVPVTVAVSMALATTWYWAGVWPRLDVGIYLALVLALGLFVLIFGQYRAFGVVQAIPNIGVGAMAILYLGLLGAFVVAIRVRFGLWPLLTYVLVVKAADIGAFTIGSLFGRHKCAPRISPGKTWEGLAGAVAGAVIVALASGPVFGIMKPVWACLFGVCFALVGQLGDLAESMIKRDAQVKDASRVVPGFGGVLDVLDSPLAAAPVAYMFFLLLKG